MCQHCDALEKHWERSKGFFGLLRDGVLDLDQYQSVLATLENIEESAGPTIEKRLVELLWFIPTFIEWQYPRVEENGGDLHALSAMQSKITDELLRILGVP